MPADLDLSARRAAWAALSELFLDTEPDLDGIVRALGATGLSVVQLEAILRREVAPVLGPNLLSVAGVWQAFDLTPVEDRFRAGRARPTLGGWWAMRAVRADWARIVAALS